MFVCDFLSGGCGGRIQEEGGVREATSESCCHW